MDLITLALVIICLHQGVTGKTSDRQDTFNTDQDIVHYLKKFNTDGMLWRCKNAQQQHSYTHEPIAVVELNCETIGVLKEANWFRGEKKITNTATEPHYFSKVFPHYFGGQYFSRWLDFTLKIFNATTADSGVYTFQAMSVSGRNLKTQLYLDITQKLPHREKRRLKRRARRKLFREYRRYFKNHLDWKDGSKQAVKNRLNHIKKYIFKL